MTTKTFCNVCDQEVELAQIRMSLELQRVAVRGTNKVELADGDIGEYRSIDVCALCANHPIRIIDLVDGTFKLQLEAIIATGHFYLNGLSDQPRSGVASQDAMAVERRR